jgi:hypothetical protein|eukprot:CAMPEP_0174381056 /NCGR_PEP_ID=MMETSP0811_2-20130205/123768_1 /TAXON_ID=73025 ORGANISM="Eutreptiella gymnastica-like, Strain CCMP1594" /NCGR_SAMPLE_ID=MMETSP0811_2 /ASSEMBLY_ACC=CAM_ASM_000667 /LENGTH=87 /DNA_ID=CAMNT_0015534091 /DNA_START=63 /DNA_END=326 /DNA_ORIENTATION=-
MARGLVVPLQHCSEVHPGPSDISFIKEGSGLAILQAGQAGGKRGQTCQGIVRMMRGPAVGNAKLITPLPGSQLETVKSIQESQGELG